MTVQRSAAQWERHVSLEIRVRGRVQGVGFRPTIWRLARELGLRGEVLNDAAGVLVRVGGSDVAVGAFIDRLQRDPPPLSVMDRIETHAFAGDLPDEFCIAESAGGDARTQVAPDAAICPACIAEVNDPFGRRYRYAFTNCTHCGPRLAIVEGIPYDRAKTTMAPFRMCAACLAENRYPLDAPPVLGIVLDGLGWGDDGAIWGGEFLLADYRRHERVGTFKPVAMLGGAKTVSEPWRNLYAHLMAEIGWAEFAMNFNELEVHAYLAAKPRATLDAMVKQGINAPPASSCGRLFDAFAAVLDICRERQGYEGHAAARLEAIVDKQTLRHEDEALGYPFAIPNLRGSGLPYVEPVSMWNAALGDLILKTPGPVMAARFHEGLAKIVVAMAQKLAERDAEDGRRFDTVALSGGCFQNRILFEEIVRRLEAEGFAVLSHAKIPCNDGGLALGQAAIGAACLIAKNNQAGRNGLCASASPVAS